VSRAAAGDEREGERVIGEGRSEYNHVVVTEEGKLRRMYFVTGGRRLLQSTYLVDQPTALHHEVFQTMISALLVQPEVHRMMMVGVGGAQVTNYLFHRIEGLEIDAVDICPEVIRLAREHFGVPESPDYRFHVADGRVFIEDDSHGSYDLLVLDAFRGHSVPEHLRTHEFFRACARRLAPGGVMVVNMHRRSGRYDSDRATLASVFPNCYRFVSEDDVQTSIVCSNETGGLSIDELRANARRLQPSFDFDLEGLATRGSQRVDWTGNEIRHLSCAPNCEGDRGRR
jgi:spermidine synthase